ncbi:DUF222 domain-containing protein [Microbacterium sp. STN6]|uniref:HNH endonuclease signature motif containing protein n=1 Tax=Microbacterium sp. STN6 TaxID=2995588 RepID=UPI0022608CE9|nr:HNH endonuclease signature motif containing protein [Microbacterium sp. STN6]MCX7522895.1 DUF222 domain-containing protein [Microbacterium sp. STN6]
MQTAGGTAIDVFVEHDSSLLEIEAAFLVAGARGRVSSPELPAFERGDDRSSEIGGERDFVFAMVKATAAAANAAAAMSCQIDAVCEALDAAQASPEAFVGPFARQGRESAEFVRRAAVAELAVELGVSEATVNRYAETGRLLQTRLPRVREGFAEGSISYAKVRIIVEQASTLPDPDAPGVDPAFARQALQAFDESMSALAPALTPVKLRIKARSLREKLHDEPLAERHRRAKAERRVWVDPAADGMAWFGAHIPADVAYRAMARITANAQNLAGLRREERTLAQLKADVAADLLTGDGTAHEVRAVVNVTVPVLTLLGDGDGDGNGNGQSKSKRDRHRTSKRDRNRNSNGAAHHSAPAPIPAAFLGLEPTGSHLPTQPATLEGYGPIDPVTARRLCGRAPSLYRVLTDPVNGAVITVDRTSYRPPADLKRLVAARFSTCTFPGCARPTDACDIDHSDAWEQGGTTSIHNLAPLCRHHHRVKHNTRWALSRTPAGGVQFTSPSGVTHDTDPPPF